MNISSYRPQYRTELREYGSSVVLVEVPVDDRSCELREYGSSVVLVDLPSQSDSFTRQSGSDDGRAGCPRWDLW